VALVLYDFPEVSTPSAEYQIVRRSHGSMALHVRVEYDPSRRADLDDLTRRLGERFRVRLGVSTHLELVARGAVPRFAYKAARVVDE
jgi:phenylacetate-coenzyme A ligase PaaK-like adenylate-forming protein